jgi:trans-aconitate methyltransferase
MLIDRPRDIYSKDFFAAQFTGALESARVIVPLVCDLIHPRRVVDIGCGRGAWLRAFHENGADCIRGFDGDYVDRFSLLIPQESFISADLAELTSLSANYDLAVCLEVLEHLSAKSGRNLVIALTEAAPVVLFSAAMPGQGGTGHVNEQWPEYWQKLFSERGFHLLDPIRPLIRDNQKVKFWYRQNILMFASQKAIADHSALKTESECRPQSAVEWVHVSIVRKERTDKWLLHTVSRAFPVRLRARLKAAISSTSTH